MNTPKIWKNNLGGLWHNTKVSSLYQDGDLQNRMGRWRRLIAPEDLFLCEWIGKKQMEEFGMKREGGPVSQEVFDRAMEIITSSSLLRECFKHWCETGQGVEKYPLNPLNPM